MAGFDYGNLARAGAVWCTDAQCSSGGWSDPRVPEDENCPGYGGDNTTLTYAPALVCNNVNDVVPKYSGGFGAPKGFEAKNFGTGSSATGVAIPAYARASPLLDEAIGAVSFGMNSFRVPFRIEYVEKRRREEKKTRCVYAVLCATCCVGGVVRCGVVLVGVRSCGGKL
jgi:hypothetical protein